MSPGAEWYARYYAEPRPRSDTDWPDLVVRVERGARLVVRRFYLDGRAHEVALRSERAEASDDAVRAELRAALDAAESRERAALFGRAGGRP